MLDELVGKKYKKLRFHASSTASESSTIAEEVVVLLRRLHPLPAWNDLINQFIGSSLQAIPSVILASGDHTSGGDTQIQVGNYSYLPYFLSPYPLPISYIHSCRGMWTIMGQYWQY